MMKKGWPNKTLGDICGFVRGPFGGSLKKSSFVKDGFAVYEQQHAIYDQFEEIRYFIDDFKFKEMQRFELSPNDLIMSCSGTMGKVAIVPDNIRQGIINQALLKLTPSKAVMPEFLKYWMGSTDFQDSLKEQSGGAAIQNVASVRILKEIKMPLPPLPEQKRIVGILDEAFESIATAKANAEKNFQNARALFESHLHAVFTHRGKEWVGKTIGEVCDFRGGGTPSKAVQRYWQGMIPWVSPKDMKSEVVSNSIDHISPEAIADSATSLIPKDAVLMVVRSGILARIIPIAVTGRELTINQDLKALCPKHMIDSRFLYYLLKSKMALLLSMVSRGATVHRLMTDQIRSLACFLPSKPEQYAIIGQIDSMQKQTQRLEFIYQQKLTALEALKKSLLHQAFTGQLTMNN